MKFVKGIGHETLATYTFCHKKPSKLKKFIDLISDYYMRTLHERSSIDHFTVVAKLPGLRMEARLPVTLF